MKRQAVGVRSIEVEQNETNGNKRIKVVHNEANKGAYETECNEEKSVMDTFLKENSHTTHYHDDHLLNSKSDSTDHAVSHGCVEKNEVDKNASEIINENGSVEKGDINHVTEANCNGSYDEVTVKVSSSDSANVLEHHSNAHENSLIQSEEIQSTENRESVAPVLNQDLQNSESTDSFQSEGFEADNCTHEAEASLEACSSQSLRSDAGISVQNNEQKSSIDLDNLLMSHVKVTELPGHSDVVCSVAADEDLVLSASGDTTVKVWSVDRQSTISTFSGHSDSVTSLLLLNQSQSKILKKKMSFAKVSRIAITGSYDCHIKLWSVLEGKELASVYTFNGISCLGYLESEFLVVVGTEGGKIELWDMCSSKAVKSIHAHQDLVSDIKVKDNYIYSVSIDGTVKVWVYEDDDIYPVYTRKRKEISSDKKEFLPTQWKTLALANNVIYLGDNSSNLKALDWRSGRLHLFKNQNEEQGICEHVLAEKNMLFSTYFDSSSDSGGINVWKLPEMSYICTLTGAAVTDVCSLAVVQRENGLRIVSGSHKLLIWDFDFSKPSNSNPQDDYYVRELETLGLEIDETSVDVKAEAAKKSNTSIPGENKSSKQWCEIM